jgi:hypothetical protein
MSINENQEFETINQKTSERNANAQAVCCSTEEIRWVKKTKARKKAALLMFVTCAVLAVALSGIAVLEEIGWINDYFSIVLKCLTGCVAVFKAGYLWHEIKN